MLDHLNHADLLEARQWYQTTRLETNQEQEFNTVPDFNTNFDLFVTKGD